MTTKRGSTLNTISHPSARAARSPALKEVRKARQELKAGSPVQLTARLEGPVPVRAYGKVVAVTSRSMDLVVTPKGRCPRSFTGVWHFRLTGGDESGLFHIRYFKRVRDACVFKAVRAPGAVHDVVVTAWKGGRDDR